MNAQTVGQWVGLVVIACVLGWLGAGVIRLVEAARDYVRARRKFAASAGAIRIVGPQLVKYEDQRRRAAAVQARAELTGDIAVWMGRGGGKEEAARLVADHFARHGAHVYFARPTPSFRDLQPANWRKHPGDFIIGERLRLDERILDGDPDARSYPITGEPPRGIFG